MLKRKLKSTSGFSLTEVMIGIMILTVAIVSASNLLVSMVQTNKVNVQSLQAYFLAQEGVEAVRNIRDTNWLHNMDFRGDQDGVFGELAVGDYYVFLSEFGWTGSRKNVDAQSTQDLNPMKPWDLKSFSHVLYNDAFGISKRESLGKNYYASAFGASEDPVFYRHIEILDACGEDTVLAESILPEECVDFMLVRSVVSWKDGGKDREVALEEVLSNWKGGAL